MQHKSILKIGLLVLGLCVFLPVTAFGQSVERTAHLKIEQKLPNDRGFFFTPSPKDGKDFYRFGYSSLVWESDDANPNDQSFSMNNVHKSNALILAPRMPKDCILDYGVGDLHPNAKQKTLNNNKISFLIHGPGCKDYDADLKLEQFEVTFQNAYIGEFYMEGGRAKKLHIKITNLP